MRRTIKHVLYAFAAASLAFAAIGAMGGIAPTAGAATAAPRSMGPVDYNTGVAGYRDTGRWFRYVSTVVTVPPSSSPAGAAFIYLVHNGGPTPRSYAYILVQPGGGSGSIGYDSLYLSGPPRTLALSPRAGDRLALSIYYDRRGHLQFSATDVTLGESATATTAADLSGGQYTAAELFAGTSSNAASPPAADIRLWAFSGSHITTYRGNHGTITGPWTTHKLIATTSGTSAGTVLLSPSGLWNSGANFGIWQRALPKYYTSALAGYQDYGGPFRFAAATVTVPPAQVPAANGGSLTVGLGSNGMAHLPFATITVRPGGGTGSLRYATNTASGTFTVSPHAGDLLTTSVYYDRRGHHVFTVTDTTRHASQTVTASAVYGSELNLAGIYAGVHNQDVVAPPADTRLWKLTDSAVTTASGIHGSILGPWQTVQYIDTTTSAPAARIVMDASVLRNAGHDFGVWLRHR